MKQLQETEATNVANKADFTQCCATKSVPRYKKTEICGAEYRKYSAEQSYSQLSDGIQSFPLHTYSHCMFMYDYSD
jgi:hypothetical protein